MLCQFLVLLPYTTHALSEVLQAWDTKRKRRSDLRLHHDNAPAHSAQLTRDFLERNQVTVLPHAPYSPDLAPADFFLFGYLKQQLQGIHFHSLDEALNTLGEIIAKIPKKTWHSVFDEWFQRLKRCIQQHGDYVNP